MAYEQHIDGDAGQYVVLGLADAAQFEEPSSWDGKLDLVILTGWLSGTSSLPLGIGERWLWGKIPITGSEPSWSAVFTDSFDEAADVANDLLRMNETLWPIVDPVVGVCYDGYLKALLVCQAASDDNKWIDRAAEVNGLEVWIAPERPDGSTNPGGMDEEEMAEADRRAEELSERVISRIGEPVKVTGFDGQEVELNTYEITSSIQLSDGMMERLENSLSSIEEWVSSALRERMEKNIALRTVLASELRAERGTPGDYGDGGILGGVTLIKPDGSTRPLDPRELCDPDVYGAIGGEGR